MLFTTLNIDNAKRTWVLCVLEPSNLERMKVADPVIVEMRRYPEAKIRYPNNVLFCVFYEEDLSQVLEYVQKGDAALANYLTRGWKDHPDDSFTFHIYPVRHSIWRRSTQR